MTLKTQPIGLTRSINPLKAQPPPADRAPGETPFSSSYTTLAPRLRQGAQASKTALLGLAAVTLPALVAAQRPLGPALAPGPGVDRDDGGCELGCILGLSIGIPVGVILLTAVGVGLCCACRNRGGGGSKAFG